MSERTTTTGIHFATAVVDGTNGMLLFPDDWDGSYPINEPDKYSADFTNNMVSLADWTVLESNGVVFLPAAGIRAEGTQVLYVQTGSIYWASTAQSNDLAYSMYFVVGEKQRGVDANYRESGASVRLVMDCSEK